MLRSAVHASRILCQSDYGPPQGSFGKSLWDVRYCCISQCRVVGRLGTEPKFTGTGTNSEVVVPLDAFVFLCGESFCAITFYFVFWIPFLSFLGACCVCPSIHAITGSCAPTFPPPPPEHPICSILFAPFPLSGHIAWHPCGVRADAIMRGWGEGFVMHDDDGIFLPRAPKVLPTFGSLSHSIALHLLSRPTFFVLFFSFHF